MGEKAGAHSGAECFGVRLRRPTDLIIKAKTELLSAFDLGANTKESDAWLGSFPSKNMVSDSALISQFAAQFGRFNRLTIDARGTRRHLQSTTIAHW